MKGWEFHPQVLAIQVGDKVTWVHDDSEDDVHNVLFEDPSIKGVDKLRQGQTFSLTFDKPGEYKYYCRFHRDNGMVGVVVVK